MNGPTSSILGGSAVHVLLCSAHVQMALKTMVSLLSMSVMPIKLVIHDDGTLTTRDVEILEAAFGPRIYVWRRADADNVLNELLQRHPNLQRFRQSFPLALKLTDCPLLETGEVVRVCDADIYFFRRFTGIFDVPPPNVASVFMHDAYDAYSVKPHDLTRLNLVGLPRCVNTGMFTLRSVAFDLDYVEWLAGRSELRWMTHWIEQTCYAALGARSGCRVWEPRQVKVITNSRALDAEVVAGHFVSGRRHLLEKVMQFQFNTTNGDTLPHFVGLTGCEECRPIHLIQTQIRLRASVQWKIIKHRIHKVGAIIAGKRN